MKNLHIILLILISTSVFSQDYIILHSGQELKVKILDFHETTVSYRLFDDMAGETFMIEKTNILLIKYQDGSTIVLRDVKNNIDTTNIKVFLNTDIKAIAIKDAKENYKTSTSAIGVGCCTATCSPIGLPAAAIVASQSPKAQNLNIPKEYENNSEYISYYSQEAHRIKRKKILIGTAIGLPVNILLFVMMFGF